MKRKIYLIVSLITLVIFLATACGAPAPTAAPAPAVPRTQVTKAPPAPTARITPVPMMTATPRPVSPPRPVATQPTKAAATTPAWQQRWDKVIAAAKKEKELNLYSSVGSSARQAITKGMKDTFGINVEFVIGRGSQISEKITAEARAGKYLADAIIIGSVNIIHNVKPSGILKPIEPSLILPEILDPKVWVGGKLPFAEKDNIGFGIVASWDTYITVNTDMIAKDEITSYYDLTKPKYKGKIALFDPLRGGTGQAAVAHIVYAMGDEEGKKVLKGLAANEPIITNNYRQLTEWIAREKYPIGIGCRVTETNDFIKLGAPLTTVRVKEGGKIGTAGGTLALTKQPPHPNAQIVFTNWILSKKGGIIFQKGFSNPSARLDVPKSPDNQHVVREGEKFYIEDEDSINAKVGLVPWSKWLFGPLMGSTAG